MRHIYLTTLYKILRHDLIYCILNINVFCLTALADFQTLFFFFHKTSLSVVWQKKQCIILQVN